MAYLRNELRGGEGLVVVRSIQIGHLEIWKSIKSPRGGFWTRALIRKAICTDSREPWLLRRKLAVWNCACSEDKFTEFATDEFQTEGIKKRVSVVSLELHSDFKASGVRKDDF